MSLAPKKLRIGLWVSFILSLSPILSFGQTSTTIKIEKKSSIKKYEVSLNGITGGNISPSQFSRLYFLQELTQNTLIVSFSLVLMDSDNSLELKSNSNNLTDEMKQQIWNIERGSIIYFSKIKGKDENGNIIVLPGFKFTLN